MNKQEKNLPEEREEHLGPDQAEAVAEAAPEEVSPEVSAGPEMRKPEAEGVTQGAEEMTPEPVEEMAPGPAEQPPKRTYTEEFTVRTEQVKGTVENLLRESNVRRIRVKNRYGRVILDIPAWAAAVGGGAAIVALPVLSALAFIGGLLANVRIEVEREEESERKPINLM